MDIKLSKVGKEYIFVRGDGSDSYENILVVPHEDNTEVYVNGDTNPVANISAGSYYIIEGDSYTNNNMYVNTSKDVFVYQGIGGTTSEANQGMFSYLWALRKLKKHFVNVLVFYTV